MLEFIGKRALAGAGTLAIAMLLAGRVQIAPLKGRLRKVSVAHKRAKTDPFGALEYANVNLEKNKGVEKNGLSTMKEHSGESAGKVTRLLLLAAWNRNCLSPRNFFATGGNSCMI